MDFIHSQRNSGFTLIELVITIIVLGVLAATAIPRFINLRGDAKKAAVENFYGSLQETVNLLHMKAQIKNKLGSDITIETDYGDYQFYRGYPETKSEATTPNLYFIETFLALGTPDHVTKNNTTRAATYADVSVYEDNGHSRIGYGTGNLINNSCYAEYLHTSSTQVFTVKTDGC
ncbi:MSHA pilin protein MshA [Moritella sp. JT01]|uniref:prepilin-type N-terminal cleavage/methylation domain-containing protein n=1 Tax=Moritella sp. JT01 TaxID=756698 RepID=UPI000795EF64|nr:type II secretion system protein [Moritella sp. JT01]KXO09522.1 MSHA pilin protein MshA [Moritella sp. JT01]